MSGRRILVAGHGPDALGALAERIARLGYDVVEAGAAAGPGGDPAAAPDLVVVHVPAGGAAAAVAAAGEARRGPGAPLLFVGADAETARTADGGAAGPEGYVVTPVEDRELRLHLELALSRSEEGRVAHDLAAFFAVSRDMFCFLGFGGTFRLLNPAWERTLGHSREELMARPFIDFVHPEDRERTLEQNRRVRAGEQAVGFENRYRHKDGSYRWFLWNSAPDVERGVIYAVARDITARREAEDERARLVTRLEASLAEVRTLRDILPICSYCRKIRDDEDYWHTVEAYLARHTGTRFSHGICPDCMAREVEPHLEG